MGPKYLFIVKGTLTVEHVEHLKKALDKFIREDNKSMIICLPPECELEVKVFNADTIEELPEITVKYEGPGPHREGTWT